MNIYKSQQIRDWDQFTIENEPISSIDLMERASKAAVDRIIELFPAQKNFAIICGNGNNGGDGFAIARILWSLGKNVQIFSFESETRSEDNSINKTRIDGFIENTLLTDDIDFTSIHTESIIIDCLLGTGTDRPLTGLYKKVVEKINSKPNKVISIDCPSGMIADKTGTELAIKADLCLTFQSPKRAFLFPENNQWIENFEILDIGLSQEFRSETSDFFITQSIIESIYPERKKFDHKGNYGHALLFVGDIDKMGAAILSSKSCMRSGVGLLSVAIPENCFSTLHTSIPEAMCVTRNDIPSTFNAIGIGCGIGTTTTIKRQFEELLEKNSSTQFVVDADAINILSKHSHLIQLIPQQSILTPHIKEFDRLFGSSKNNEERITKGLAFCKKHNTYIVLKGAHSAILCANGEVYFNSTGNPGMATAGSGDVLCGIITALVAQGIESKSACILGVYLHGLAGDYAMLEFGQTSLLASDIVNKLSFAFKSIEKLPKFNS